MPGYAFFDEIRSSYPIYIEIIFLPNRLTRLFILKEAKNEYKSFLKIWDKHYTIIDHETNQSLNISRDMFTEVVSNIFFE
ncbi:MAG TPA: hypothetical protein VKB95_07955 [Chitinophagaceae bacterium]|nr:hypothetical protein [Chitinophagaceae bacterium]